MNESALMTANAIPCDAGNRLRVVLWNGLDTSGFVIQCRYQILNKDGTISQNYAELTVLNAAAATAHELSLAPGFLLAVTLSTFNTVIQHGDLYATISLQYGNVSTASQQLPIMAGYILANAPLNYPLSQIEAINSGAASATEQSLPDPGPGTTFLIDMPPTARGIIRALSFVLTTGAAVPARTVILKWYTANADYYHTQAISTQAASQTKTYQLWIGTTPPTPPTDVIYIPAPEMPPMQGLQVEPITANFDGSDGYTSIRWLDEHHVAM